jgi:hypothetical protein
MDTPILGDVGQCAFRHAPARPALESRCPTRSPENVRGNLAAFSSLGARDRDLVRREPLEEGQAVALATVYQPHSKYTGYRD